MPVNQAKVQAKLAAILAKDLDALIAGQVYLPFVGSSHSKGTLAAWFKKRRDVLEDVLAGAYTDQQIESYIVNKYQALGPADKAIADLIRNGGMFDLGAASGASAYETLVLIVLAKFAVRPD